MCSTPKVALFFLAFLPQFVHRENNVAAQIIFLGVLFNTSGTLVNIIVALVASYTRSQFKTHIRNSSVFRWLTGSIFIGAWCPSRAASMKIIENLF